MEPEAAVQELKQLRTQLQHEQRSQVNATVSHALELLRSCCSQ